MEAIAKRPLFTEVYETPSAFQPADGAAYIYGAFKERSEHVENLRAVADAVQFVRIYEREPPIVHAHSQEGEAISLRSRKSIAKFLKSLDGALLYIDITGLSHHVWAPLLAVALEHGQNVRGVYVEPRSYQYNANPRQGEIFDLSERIDGIAPLPLFTRLEEPRTEDVCFVPLLGFEGARFAYVNEQIEPPGGKIVPIIGVPGYRPEYPFHTYLGNQLVLAETRAWKNVRFARANCPFHLFYVLEDIMKKFDGAYFKIAPIGTKPHALGAVLKCLSSNRRLELVYDNPRQKRTRSAGMMRCLVYSISDFLKENPAACAGQA